MGLFITSLYSWALQPYLGRCNFMHIAELCEKASIYKKVWIKVTTGLVKWLVYFQAIQNGEIQDTRLGHFANKYADKIDARLSAQGMKALLLRVSSAATH